MKNKFACLGVIVGILLFTPVHARTMIAQINCLAENIYHEVRGESVKGRLAVGMVTMNRVDSPLFPGDVCSVVKQRNSDLCQFSWYCDKSKRNFFKVPERKARESYLKSFMMATHVFLNYRDIEDPTKGSLYYHRKTLRVKRPGKVTKAIIDDHLFYNVIGRK